MATKKRTTKAKSKTTNKKTVAAKNSTASVTSKFAIVKGLRRLHTVSAVVFGLLALAAVFFMKHATLPITMPYVTQDALASNSSAVLVSASRRLWDLQLRWAVVAVMVLSLIVPLLYMFKYPKKYQRALDNKIVFWRWLDLAVTGAVMVEVIALLSGIQDVVSLKLIGLTMVLVAMFGWLGERHKKLNGGRSKTTFTLLVLTKAVLIVLLAMPLIATLIYGMVRCPWYTYALFVGLVASLVLYAFNQYNFLRDYKNWRDYIVVERNYTLISLATKLGFGLVLVIGLMR